jgi:hypothetical protein
METGIKLIEKERIEQITKHNRSTENDIILNDKHQLSAAAAILCMEDWGCNSEEDIIEDFCPKGWDISIWENMVKKPYKERVIIAGALLAAELDRLTVLTEKGELY